MWSSALRLCANLRAPQTTPKPRAAPGGRQRSRTMFNRTQVIFPTLTRFLATLLQNPSSSRIVYHDHLALCPHERPLWIGRPRFTQMCTPLMAPGMQHTTAAERTPDHVKPKTHLCIPPVDVKQSCLAFNYWLPQS